MLESLGLILLVLALFVLRQNLLVVLGAVTAFAYLVFGDGMLANIVIDAWAALNKEILLSIPLFIQDYLPFNLEPRFSWLDLGIGLLFGWLNRLLGYK